MRVERLDTSTGLVAHNVLRTAAGRISKTLIAKMSRCLSEVRILDAKAKLKMSAKRATLINRFCMGTAASFRLAALCAVTCWAGPCQSTSMITKASREEAKL